jgi:hypothetical protein
MVKIFLLIIGKFNYDKKHDYVLVINLKLFIY